MDDKILFQSSRRFVMSLYILGRGLLLLRSFKDNEFATRVDVLFQDVRAMELRCWFEGLTVQEADQDFLGGYRSNPVEMIEHGNKIYALSGKGWGGFIVGGIVRSLEDEGNPMDPSGLTGPMPEGQFRILGERLPYRKAIWQR